MLKLLGEKASERKLRLFACGYYRHIWHLLTEPRARHLVEVSERCADGLVGHQALAGARGDGARRSMASAVWFVADDVAWLAAVRTAGNYHFRYVTREETWKGDQAGLLRDIFGGPFRPVAADPAWLTPTVAALAEGIYHDRAWDRLPILGDALQDAGCENGDLLGRLRPPGPHIRGCWAVDVVLGRG